MKCDEKGCGVSIEISAAYVPSLDDIAAAAGKKVVELTAEDLADFAVCEGCYFLHTQVAGEKYYSFAESLATIQRLKDRIATARKERAEHAVRQAQGSLLGAALLAAGFKPSAAQLQTT